MVQELCVENIVSSLEIKMCNIDLSIFHTNRFLNQKFQYNSSAKTSPHTSLYISACFLYTSALSVRLELISVFR